VLKTQICVTRPQCVNICFLGVPPPYADSIALSHHSPFTHYCNDEGGWEMPKVYTETYMKSNWSKTEVFKLSNQSLCTVRLRYQTDCWKLKSTRMWCCVTGQVVLDVAKCHSAFEMWGTTYPTLQHNIPGDLICSNTTVGTATLAHTDSCNCHVSMQSSCVCVCECLGVQHSMNREKDFCLCKSCVYF
jgi:hypothetical protein